MRRLLALIGRVDNGISEAGMTTAEYAVGTVAACGFAGVLYKVLTSSAVEHIIAKLIKYALSFVL